MEDETSALHYNIKMNYKLVSLMCWGKKNLAALCCHWITAYVLILGAATLHPVCTHVFHYLIWRYHSPSTYVNTLKKRQSLVGELYHARLPPKLPKVGNSCKCWKSLYSSTSKVLHNVTSHHRCSLAFDCWSSTLHKARYSRCFKFWLPTFAFTCPIHGFKSST